MLSAGPVAKIRLLGDYHHPTRIAFVEFTNAESARAALNCSGAMLGESYAFSMLHEATLYFVLHVNLFADLGQACQASATCCFTAWHAGPDLP